MKLRLVLVVTLCAAFGACNLPDDKGDDASGGSGGSGGKSTTITTGGRTGGISKLPDGTSCAPAPADSPGASAAWQGFLNWHAANAPQCGDTYQWPSYECITRQADPRTIPAFTQCMMADGCNSISNEDACAANPQNPSAGLQLSAAANDWFQNVCIPRSATCGFSNDWCSVFVPTTRPELRCAVVDCVNGTCANFDTCIKAVLAAFPTCTK